MLAGTEDQITFYIAGLSAVKKRAFRAVRLDIATLNSKEESSDGEGGEGGNNTSLEANTTLSEEEKQKKK